MYPFGDQDVFFSSLESVLNKLSIEGNENNIIILEEININN